MSRYRVRLSRDITESVDLTVEARNRGEAHYVAIHQYLNGATLRWTANDDSRYGPYIADWPGDIEELEEEHASE